MTTYGYVRISTWKQKIERQIDNIKREYPDAVIISETFTGARSDRPAWTKLEKKLKQGDVVVFDEVSRMMRDEEEGLALYEKLFDRGVGMAFLKEPHINSEVYRCQLDRQIERISGTGSEAADKLIDTILEALHTYTIDLAKEQIRLAFRTAQKELDLCHQRTREAVIRAQVSGKQVGRAQGSIIETKKAKAAKPLILKHSKSFGGSLSDAECMKLLGVARNSYYKYKRELKNGECNSDE